MDVATLVNNLIEDRAFLPIMNNPLAFLGPKNRPLLGATLLPEKPVTENSFVEDGIRYRTIIANDGTRYSPVQLKGSVMTGQFQVILGNSDTGSQFDGSQYDTLLRLIRDVAPGSSPSMQAVTQLISWVDTTLNLPLIEKNEKQRWEAIVAASVVRTGDNGYTETVAMPNPTGHRVALTDAWSDDTVDPWVDLMNVVQFMASKGYQVNRIISSTPVVSILSKNAKIRARAGINSIAAGTIVGLAGTVDLATLNTLLSRDGLPPIEKYDLQYLTQTSSGYFLQRDAMVFVSTTGRDQSIDRGDLEPVVFQNTLGYTAVGRAAGQTAPGRVVDIASFTNKPPRIQGEAWQTSFPVMQDPEAVMVYTNIH